MLSRVSEYVLHDHHRIVDHHSRRERQPRQGNHIHRSPEGSQQDEGPDQTERNRHRDGEGRDDRAQKQKQNNGRTDRTDHQIPGDPGNGIPDIRGGIVVDPELQTGGLIFIIDPLGLGPNPTRDGNRIGPRDLGNTDRHRRFPHRPPHRLGFFEPVHDLRDILDPNDAIVTFLHDRPTNLLQIGVLPERSHHQSRSPILKIPATPILVFPPKRFPDFVDGDFP